MNERHFKLWSIEKTTTNHIWNTPYAFACPALATDPNGNIRVSVLRRPQQLPQHHGRPLADSVVYFVEASDVTLTFTQTNEAQLCSECGEPIPTAGVKANPANNLVCRL